MDSHFNSQDGQDEFLEKNVFKGLKCGIFMDIGANDGVTINNTLYFETTNGWTGINVEPIKEVFDKLLQNRPKCININCAVDKKNGTAEFIKNRGYSEMISGLKAQFDRRHVARLNNELDSHGGSSEVIHVETKTIESICKENNISTINYLSIDVEGAEFDVIKSINFETVFIDVIGFENNYDDNSEPIVEYLQEKGYTFLHKNMDIFMIHRDSIFNRLN
jgi:FkbM family methyltransferase